MESLAGKVVIITGGSSGIGEAIALKFASFGCKICITGRHTENLERVADQCRKNGAKTTEIITVCGDVKDQEHRKDIIARTVEHFGKIDILVNNAGILHVKHVAETSEQEYADIFDTNVKAYLFLAQLAIPYLKESKGNIINNSSIAAEQPLSCIGVTCMSKAAVNMLTECLAIDLGPSGVRVNSINPGVTETEVFKRSGMPESELDKRQATRNPLQKSGRPSDCADAVAFLASDAAGHVTGQHLNVDGGRHCVVVDVD